VARYEVRYDDHGRERGTFIDAYQLSLRVYRDGEYFQFVGAIAPGPDYTIRVRSAADFTPDQFWRAFAGEAGPLIEGAVRARQMPLADPTLRFELRPPFLLAVQRAPEAENRPLEEDDVVHTFEAW
jgi:hypothetical protein